MFASAVKLEQIVDILECGCGCFMAYCFASQKKRVLGRLDRSKKGGIDVPIAGLIDALNSSPAYFTTSSCSGRIVVFGGHGSEVVSL